MSAPWSVFVDTTEPRKIRDAAEDLIGSPDDLIVVLLAEGGGPDLGAVASALGALANPFFGGLFPELLVGGQRRRQGALLLRFGGMGAPIVVHDFDDTGAALTEATARVSRAGGRPPTALVLVDGLAPNISHLLGSTYNELGGSVRYWGGGAGSVTLEQVPCLFTRDGAFSGGAIVGLTTQYARLGVHHGWQHCCGPLVATRTDGNTVLQLNWRNAAAEYAAAVSNGAAQCNPRFDTSDLDPGYPLGLQRQGDEVIVRDPIAVSEDGALICVGDVPENAVLSILHGEPDDVIDAAFAAAQEAGAPDVGPARHCLVADCISRVEFLADDFGRELEAIDRGLGDLANDAPAVGVLTLGEISSRGDGYLEFFNKTCVVAVLRED